MKSASSIRIRKVTYLRRIFDIEFFSYRKYDAIYYQSFVMKNPFDCHKYLIFIEKVNAYTFLRWIDIKSEKKWFLPVLTWRKIRQRHWDVWFVMQKIPNIQIPTFSTYNVVYLCLLIKVRHKEFIKEKIPGREVVTRGTFFHRRRRFSKKNF